MHMLSRHASHGITGVLLAAGIGSRYDPSGQTFKLLAPVDTDVNLIQASARRLATACSELIVVHGPRSRDSYPAVQDLAARQISCIHAAAGMGSSL